MTNIYKYPGNEYVIQCAYCGTLLESSMNELPSEPEKVPYEVQCISGCCRHDNFITNLIDYSDLYDKGYECTDGDNYQFVKKISETEYIVIDGNKVHDIDLDDYTDTEIRDYVSGYYPSLEDLKEQYTEEFCN